MNSIHISIVFIVAFCGSISSQAVYPKHGEICFNSIDEIEQRIITFVRNEMHTFMEEIRKTLMTEKSHTRNEIEILNSTWKNALNGVQDRSLKNDMNNVLNQLVQEANDTKYLVENLHNNMKNHLTIINNTLTDIQNKDEAVELKMSKQGKEVDDIHAAVRQLSGNYTLIKKELSSLPNMKSQISSLTYAKNRLDREVSSYRSLSGRITTAQTKANSAYNYAKGIGVVCSWTAYQNNYDKNVRYVVPSGYTIRGMHSVHDNKREDRRFKYYICS